MGLLDNISNSENLTWKCFIWMESINVNEERSSHLSVPKKEKFKNNILKNENEQKRTHIPKNNFEKYNAPQIYWPSKSRNNELNI